jgi:DNA mismatch endonuclease (patch repair protein)
LTDTVDAATRSRIMRSVKRRSSGPEIALRRRLHAMGFRYRLGGRGLPGTPDLVFPKASAVVFVHGCFWHRHPGCRRATTPKSRTDYWLPKFARNVERDREVVAALKANGWHVAIAWECELTATRADATAERVAEWLSSLCRDARGPGGNAAPSAP